MDLLDLYYFELIVDCAFQQHLSCLQILAAYAHFLIYNLHFHIVFNQLLYLLFLLFDVIVL